MIGQTFAWKGFETIPSGCLLEQVVDLSNDMGFAYERSTKFYKDFHTHDRLMLIFPRGTSAMEVRTKNPKETFVVDYETVLYVPKHLEHDDEGITSIYDTMAFYPSDKMLEDAAKKFGLSDEQFRQLTSGCIKIRRTERLNAIAQGYFLERIVLNKKNYDQEAIIFLGRRLLEEAIMVTFNVKGRQDSLKAEPVDDPKDSITVRAVRFIEANLFEPLEVPAIAKQSFASVSTLLRRFKSDVGVTPYLYIKNRRLEEGMRLLKTGDYPVSDVAMLVGYENFGAFSEAFKEKYGDSPSHYKGATEKS
jgi:AraC-like DNA-binding protein